MAFDLDNEELKATRKLHNQDDGLYEETSDKNVENIETTNNKNKYTYIKEVAEKIVNEYREKYKGEKFCPEPSEQTCMAYEILHLLTELKEDKKRIQELKEENKKLKASHIFTRNNNATDEEKAKLYDVIDNTIDTFLEQKNQKWEQIMTTNKMSVDEAIDIVDKMYQDRYKAIEKDDTILVNKLDDIKFTNLEFASVILLREVQSLQSNLENSIPKQKVKDKIEKLRHDIKLGNCRYPYIEEHKIEILQELLEGSEDK